MLLPQSRVYLASLSKVCAVAWSMWETCVDRCNLSQGPGAGVDYTTSFLTGADFASAPDAAAVLAGCNDGAVRLFDLRTSHASGPDLEFRSHERRPLTGIAVRKSGVLVTASQGAMSELHFSDIRMASSAPTECAALRCTALRLGNPHLVFFAFRVI
jgi:hypothetical protein